jgi:ABC-2 type transport system permease protein
MPKRYKQMGSMAYNYPEVIWRLSVTDFRLKYQGSFFGYLWSLVKPLFLFAVLYLVFSHFSRLGSTPHYPLYLLIGVVVWSFFVDITLVSLHSITGRSDLIRKVSFPRIILPISSSLTSLMTFLLNFIVVVVFALFNHLSLGWGLLMVPLYILELYILALGISLFLSAWNIKFKDVAHIWEVIVQAAFYLTPILYPITIFPHQYVKLVLLSPVAQIIQAIRGAFIQSSESTYALSGLSVTVFAWVVPFIIFGLGLWYFNKVSPYFAEEA